MVPAVSSSPNDLVPRTSLYAGRSCSGGCPRPQPALHGGAALLMRGLSPRSAVLREQFAERGEAGYGGRLKERDARFARQRDGLAPDRAPGDEPHAPLSSAMLHALQRSPRMPTPAESSVQGTTPSASVTVRQPCALPGHSSFSRSGRSPPSASPTGSRARPRSPAAAVPRRAAGRRAARSRSGCRPPAQSSTTAPSPRAPRCARSGSPGRRGRPGRHCTRNFSASPPLSQDVAARRSGSIAVRGSPFHCALTGGSAATSRPTSAGSAPALRTGPTPKSASSSTPLESGASARTTSTLKAERSAVGRRLAGTVEHPPERVPLVHGEHGEAPVAGRRWRRDRFRPCSSPGSVSSLTALSDSPVSGR